MQVFLKPQSLNQARLFTIESRIKETEKSKVSDLNFLKETIKKLIYAIEQSHKTPAGKIKNQKDWPLTPEEA